MNMRIGHGWDRHQLIPDVPMYIGGVKIESSKGIKGFSDGDAALHAVVDALLGAAGLGDIGQHFPSGEGKWKGVSSRKLLSRTVEMVENAGWSAVNIDLTVIIESPRLGPYRDDMKSTIRRQFSNNPPVNIKFKTADELGPVGEGRAIESHCVTLLKRFNPTPSSGDWCKIV